MLTNWNSSKNLKQKEEEEDDDNGRGGGKNEHNYIVLPAYVIY